MNLSSKENDVKRLVEEMIYIKEEQAKSDLVINVSMKTDEESFEVFKRKLIELKEELNKKEFRILSKDSFIEWFLCNSSEIINNKITNSEEACRVWEEVRKEYNFVILAGEMIYSVEYFNKVIGGNYESKL